jgi:hypothetical protein
MPNRSATSIDRFAAERNDQLELEIVVLPYDGTTMMDRAF